GGGSNAEGRSKAAMMVWGWAAEHEARFDVERLLDLHRTIAGAPAGVEVLRKTEPMPINATHDPTPALLLPRMLDNAFDWFNTESFKDLHPVERAAVVYLRLLDLQPFPSHTETQATLAASFYTGREA